MPQFRPFDPAGDSVDAAWTFPAYRHLLSLQPANRFSQHGKSGKVQPMAHVALVRDRPVALGLGCLPLEADAVDRPCGELLSLFVVPEHRRSGICTRLVSELERSVEKAGFREIETVYMTGTRWIDPVERSLRRRGWSKPEPRMLALRGTLDEALSTRWFGRYPLREGFELVSWHEVGNARIEALRDSDLKEPWIAEDLRPWTYDTSYLEPASSVGVLLDGELVGWILNHPVDEISLRVTCAFLRPDLSRRARLMPVLTESLSRARDAGFERVLFTVPVYHRQMVRFTRRWCGPFATFVGETRSSRKVLGARLRLSS